MTQQAGLDKTDYAIIGWVDAGQPADADAIAAMLGLKVTEAMARVIKLRDLGILPLALCTRLHHHWRLHDPAKARGNGGLRQ